MTNEEIKKRESLFLEVFESSRFFWSGDHKRKYLQHLRSQIAITDRKRGDIPDSLISSTVSGDEVYKAIQPYDPQLDIFCSYHEQFENSGMKIVEFFRLNQFSSSEITSILSSLKEKKYSFDSVEGMVPISVKKLDKVIEIHFARESKKVTNIKLERDILGEETWGYIQSIAKEKLHIGNFLLDVSAKTLADKRTIIRIKIDFTNQYVEISSDNFDTTDDGKKKGIREAQIERKAALCAASTFLGIKDTKALDRLVNKENALLSKEVMTELQKYHDHELLIVHNRESYKTTDSTAQEYNENVTSNLENQKITQIIPKAEMEYDSTGTFKRFFINHKEHNTERAKYIRMLKADPQATIESYRAYAIIVRNAKPEEKPLKYENHMKGKVVDFLSFNYNYDENILEIRNSDYAQEDFNVIVSKILELSGKTPVLSK